MSEQKSRLTIFQIFSYFLLAGNALFLYLGLFIFGYFLATGRISLSGFTALAGMIYIGVPLAWVCIAAGLLRRQPRARIFAIILSGFSLMTLVYLSVTAKGSQAHFSSLWPLSVFFGSVLVVMFMPRTKEQFGLLRKTF